MIETKKNEQRKDFLSFIKHDIVKQARKVKGKHPPIIEVVEKKSKVLEIEAIYDLYSTLKFFYLFVVKDKSENHKTRYMLAISLANQSSDFLSELAKKLITKGDGFKLIQYAVIPKVFRINLLLLKEFITIDDYSISIEILRETRSMYRKKIINLVDKTETQ
ncbi:MAG: hypothetical protein ACFFAS_11620 [Promethearchaeota archaeon]